MNTLELQADDVVRLNGHKAQVVNGWAAGGPWYQFLFLEGPYKGLAVWLEPVSNSTMLYSEDVNDDGFGFNWVTFPAPDAIDLIDGNLLPIASGTTLSIEEDPT